MSYTDSGCSEVFARRSDYLCEPLPTNSAFEIAIKLLLRTSMLALLMVGTLALAENAVGQYLEVHGGYTHVTGDFGTNGFNAGAAWWFTNRVTVAADYDSTWNTSTIGTFAITSVGPIVSNAHLQSLVFGPRIFFPLKKVEEHRLHPFAEVQVGFSHINTRVRQVTGPTNVSSSDTAYSWLLGGGVEYLFSPHWSGRANLDLLRTHFAAQGQSRLRFVLGVTYTFGEKETKPKQPKENKK